VAVGRATHLRRQVLRDGREAGAQENG